MGPLLILTLIIISTSVNSQNPSVNTPLGEIFGKTIAFDNIPVFTFQGIPYAEPPIGPYRFKRTVPVEAWDQPLQAYHLPPACLQYTVNPYPWADNLLGKSEDCLYLNIWTPADASPSNKKSVMLFLHGGGFTIGSSRIDYHDGRVLAALGDIIFVSANYRLGPMGFLYSGTEDAPGNMALYDVLEALKWIHANIEYFGGDKHSVTLAGQSAGSITTGMCITSPLFEGLFVRGIMNSGSPVNPNGDNAVVEDFRLTNKIAKAVGCAKRGQSLRNQPEDVMSCMRDVDGMTLITTMDRVNNYPLHALYPSFGDEILPQLPRKAIIDGNFANVSVLIGYTNDEHTMMLTERYYDYFGFYGEKNHYINKTFGENILRRLFKNFIDTDVVIDHYLGNLGEEDYDEIIHQVASAPGDYVRICPVIYFAEKLSEEGRPVYFYNFRHRPSISPFAPWMGSVHFDEIPFVFGYPLRYPQLYTESEREFSRIMLDIWTSFVKTGVPSLQPWPLFSKETGVHLPLHIGQITVEYRPHLENCNFFRKYFGF